MKNLVVLFCLVFSISANANCKRDLEARLTAEFDQKNWSYHGLQKQTEREVWDLVENSQLEENASDALKMHLEEDSFEFYLLAGTAEVSSGFQEMIVADKNNCRIANRIELFVE